MSSHGFTAASGPPATTTDPIVASVTSFDGTIITYDLYEAPSQTTIVVVPGFWRDRRHPAMRRLAAFLGDLGYRTAIIDVRGHGESGGTYGFNVHEHHDVAAVSNDLLARGGTSALTFVGFSYGAAIAISTTARHDLPVASLLLISAVAGFEMIAPRVNPFTIHRHIAFFSQAMHAPRFVWRMRKLPKIRAVDDLVNVHAPLCLIHVKNDWLIGHRHSVALYDAANEPKELHLLDIAGNYHADRIFKVASESIEPIVRDFLARHSPV
jgi:uncharacterized protein